MGFTHGWQWYSSSNTQAYWNSGCKILLFVNRGKRVDGRAEWTVFMSMYLRPLRVCAKFNLGQLVKVQAQELRTPNQWGITHTYKQWYAPTATHLTLIFTLYISPKPLFLPKIVTQSPIFSHCPEFWKFFTQRPLIGWNLRKRYPNVPNFCGVCHWKTPYFLDCIHMVCLRGMLLPQTQSEAGKFCILETESCNLVNTFKCKFNKGDENKISVLQAQPTQLCTMDEFHWRAGMIYRLLSRLQPASPKVH